MARKQREIRVGVIGVGRGQSFMQGAGPLVGMKLVALCDTWKDKLDEAGKTFKVLLIKTPLTKPYTSVFFQLECGYWNADSEAELRKAIKQQ